MWHGDDFGSGEETRGGKVQGANPAQSIWLMLRIAIKDRLRSIVNTFNLMASRGCFPKRQRERRRKRERGDEG